VDEFIRMVPAIQAAASLALLVVAIISVWWAIATFAQREQHEAAKEVPHVALQLQTFNWNPFQQPLDFMFEDDMNRPNRWLTNFVGNGWDVAMLALRQQLSSCSLICLGPGTVTSAEVPYTVEIFDHPLTGQAPVEQFDGVFHFYHVPPGEVRRATVALFTTYYPYVRVRLGTPVVRDRSGGVANVTPDSHLSALEMVRLNRDSWNFLKSTQQDAAPGAGPPIRPA